MTIASYTPTQPRKVVGSLLQLFRQCYCHLHFIFTFGANAICVSAGGGPAVTADNFLGLAGALHLAVTLLMPKSPEVPQ